MHNLNTFRRQILNETGQKACVYNYKCVSTVTDKQKQNILLSLAFWHDCTGTTRPNIISQGHTDIRHKQQHYVNRNRDVNRYSSSNTVIIQLLAHILTTTPGLQCQTT